MKKKRRNSPLALGGRRGPPQPERQRRAQHALPPKLPPPLLQPKAKSLVPFYSQEDSADTPYYDLRCNVDGKSQDAWQRALTLRTIIHQLPDDHDLREALSDWFHPWLLNNLRVFAPEAYPRRLTSVFQYLRKKTNQ